MNTNDKSTLEAEVSRLRMEVESHRVARLHNEHVAFCEGLAGVWPAWREAAIANLDHLAALPVAVEFGEGEDKAPLLDAFKAMLSALPPAVQFGEFASHDRAVTGTGASSSFVAAAGSTADAASLRVHEAALRHQKTNGGTYIDAVNAVT